MTALKVVAMATILATGTHVAASTRPGRSQSPTDVPVFAAWPFNLDHERWWSEQGWVDFDVVVSNGIVTTADPVDKSKSEIATRGSETLRRWQFNPSFNSRLRLTLSHRTEGVAGCDRDVNQKISVSWPNRVEVISKRPLVAICDPAVTTIAYEEPVSVVTGTVWCDCPGSKLLAGLILEVAELDKKGATARYVVADHQGRFRISFSVPGRYSIKPRFDSYPRREFVVKYAPDGWPLELDIPQTPLIPIATEVVAGGIPFYPPELRAAGRQGNVDVRVSFQKDRAVDIDAQSTDSGLAAATIANISTWQFKSTSVHVHTLRFSYVLERTDCRRPPLHAVVMELPSEVTIRASMPCSGLELLQSPFAK